MPYCIKGIEIFYIKPPVIAIFTVCVVKITTRSEAAELDLLQMQEITGLRPKKTLYG